MEEPQQKKSDGDRFFTCDICVEKLSLERKFEGCSLHPYCTDCVAKCVDIQLTYRNISEITCPNINCNVKLDPSSCQSVLPKRVFEKWCRALCESVVLLNASKGGLAYGRSYCPYPNCSELVLNECVKKSRWSTITKSNCPSCKQLFCFHCMVPWEEKHQCISSGETVINIDSEDDLFMETARRKRWRRCPSCHHYVERNEGCKNITCRCGTVFCHDCGSSSCICNGQQPWCVRICQWFLFSFLSLSMLFLLGLEIYFILAAFGLVPDIIEAFATKKTEYN